MNSDNSPQRGRGHRRQSGGIGRAAARCSPSGATASPCWPAARRARGRRPRGRDGGRPRAVVPSTSPTTRRSTRRRPVEDELGPIDVWVNDAFTSVFAPFMEIEPEEFRRVTEVTYLGFVYGTRAALSRMRRATAASIVQVGSALAYRGIPLQSAYCGAKHAIQGFHESLRTELLHDRSNVHVTVGPAAGGEHAAVLLGAVPAAAQAQPVPPIYQPEVAAAGSCTPPTTRGAGATGSAPPPPAPCSPTTSPACWTATSRAPASSQQTPEAEPADRRPTSGSPLDGADGPTSAPTASSTTRPTPRSPQQWSSQHRHELPLAGAGLAAGAALPARRPA